MTKLIFILSFSLGSLAFASNITLDELYEEMKADYRNSGIDNNNLAVMAEIEYHQPLNISPVTELEDIKRVLANCVFLSEGAYGRHLSPQAQSDLIDKYSGQIYNRLGFISVGEIERIYVDGLKADKCALSLRDQEQKLIIQGYLID